MVVALGTLVYGFASTAFGGFGSGFSNLVQSAGQQLDENVAIEQIYFFSANNSVSGCSFGSPLEMCGGVLFIRNVGADPVELDTIYMVNVSAGVALSTYAASTVHPDCYSNNMTQGSVCFTAWSSWTSPSSNQYLNNFLLQSSKESPPFQIDPGQVAVVHFVLPVYTSACNTSTPPSYCAVIHGGTVYSFTIVTSRGNNFVAYAKA